MAIVGQEVRNILQRSVATHFRCVGIFTIAAITNLLLDLKVNDFKRNRSVFGEVTGKKWNTAY